MSIITSSSAYGSSETTSGLDQLLPERGPQRAIGLDVAIRGLPTARSERNDANMRTGSVWLASLRTRAGDRRRSDSVSAPAADPRWWSAHCLGPVRIRCAGGGTALPAHQAPLRPARSRLVRHRADRRRIRP